MILQEKFSKRFQVWRFLLPKAKYYIRLAELNHF